MAFLKEVNKNKIKREGKSYLFEMRLHINKSPELRQKDSAIGRIFLLNN